ncbi:mannose-6-phosphate receptor binding protein 1 isoform X2 [Puntigrus tetrazona]|uniref:mannose-6-phosphate receptor binding protein 1 isoform X2 n=1 Tax=Puntigrus tetrazona TaxID=1606681 RepID=UPI001C8A4AB2|nr:mannose-6-phosphate receptor binding protein 1 isoform X2 [Puntigrus tetrazona]
MADNGKTVEKDTEASHATQEQQSVVSRMSNLPLVSSACGAMYNAYSSTKDSVPLLKGVMEVAESGVRTLGAAASTGSKPILDRLEPQIAAVNEYAIKGLEKVEENLPILQQPADKLVSNTVGMVYQSVTGAKDAVVGAVLGGVEKTRMAVAGGINTVMGTRVGQMVSNGVDKALTQSEDWVDQNLPISEKELAALAEPRPGEEEGFVVTARPSYFVRLGKLSAKVQERALEQSLIRARRARDTTHAAVTQMTSTMDLLESARVTLASANQQLGGAPEQLLQRWKEWKEGQPKELQEKVTAETAVDTAKDKKEELESRALSMVQGLSNQLKAACSGVVSSVQGLPGTVQEQLLNARHTAGELQASLSSTKILTPILLEQTRQQIGQVRQSLDGVVDYLLNNTPLNWLVGPFAPQITEKGD